MNGRHLLASVATLLAVGGLGRPAVAQSAQDLLRDVDTFRTVFGPAVVLNVTQLDATPRTVRLQLSCDAPQQLSPTPEPLADSAPAPQRLLVAALCSGTLDAAFEGLGVTFAPQLLSFEVWHEAGTPLLVRRIGSAGASIAIEPSIARPRQYRIQTTDGVWSVELTSYLEGRNGWYPQTAIVRRDNAIVLRWAILDAAATAESLAPLPTQGPQTTLTGTAQRPDVRFPYLPL